MIDSPLIRELVSENTQQTQYEAILLVLEERFGTVSDQITASLKSVHKKTELVALLRFAVKCHDLEAFQARLPVERPRPPSSRKTPKRRKPSTDP
jgi:hypothetical protein